MKEGGGQGEGGGEKGREWEGGREGEGGREEEGEGGRGRRGGRGWEVKEGEVRMEGCRCIFAFHEIESLVVVCYLLSL